MAENETLNLGKTPRWKRVHRAVMEGESKESVAEKARANLCRTLRVLQEQIPFEQLLSAACNDPSALPDLTRRCGKGREFAELFHAIAKKGISRDELLRDYFGRVCDSFLDQIEVSSFPSARWTNLPDLRCHLAQIRELLEEEIERIAQKLAEDPKWRPRTRPSRNSSSSTGNLLNESLLEVVRK